MHCHKNSAGIGNRFEALITVLGIGNQSDRYQARYGNAHLRYFLVTVTGHVNPAGTEQGTVMGNQSHLYPALHRKDLPGYYVVPRYSVGAGSATK